MQDREIVEFAQKLAAAGIQLSANYEPIGCSFGLKPSDLPLYLADRDGFFAHECAVGKDVYREWKTFLLSGCPCGAPRADGGTCENRVSFAKGLSPQEYQRRKAEGSLRCSRHASVR